MSWEEGPSARRSAAVDAPAENPEPPVRVVVLLSNGERIELASSPDQSGAVVLAKRLIQTLDERLPGAWPFVGGRFLRPDAIVSVDVVEPADIPDALVGRPV